MKGLKGIWAEFKKFITRGNVLDLAVGVVVGSAFTAIVTSLTNDIIMPLINSVVGTFALDKVKTQVEENGKLRTKKVSEYSFVIGGQKFKAPLDVAQKMFAALSGRKVFNTTFRYEFTPYNFKMARSGLPATVEKLLDYGAEKFIKCNVCGSDFYIRSEKSCSGDIYLAPDFESIGVIEMGREIKIV